VIASRSQALLQVVLSEVVDHVESHNGSYAKIPGAGACFNQMPAPVLDDVTCWQEKSRVWFSSANFGIGKNHAVSIKNASKWGLREAGWTDILFVLYIGTDLWLAIVN